MKIGIIGAGNMASALAGGLITAGVVSSDELSISDINPVGLERWKKLGVFSTQSNVEVIGRSDIVILAVKPNVLPCVLEEISPKLANKVLISIAAGVQIEAMEKILGSDVKIIRAMPNTPAQVNCGMTVIAPNKNISASELDDAKAVLSGVGDVVVLEEKYINAATAIHGSSPAYIYMLIDAMADCGVKYGIPKNISLQLAAKAVEGSAKMVLENNVHPQALKDAVCSPGGTTIEAVLELEKTGFKSSIAQAIDKCVKKADEMSK